MRPACVLRPVRAVLLLAAMLAPWPGAAAAPFLGLPPGPPAPRAAAVDLGRHLFFDRRLSANGTLSCGMCHIPEQGFAQNELATPVGFEGRSVRRNAPSLYNVALLGALFHDGRETSLERQIWGPLLAHDEMGNADPAAVIDRLRSIDGYVGAFAAVYPGGITPDTLADALASYQRTLLSGNSRFDRWRYDGATAALDQREQQGHALFVSRGCSSCHTVGDTFAMFTDGGYHNTGIAYRSRHRGTPERLQVAPGVTIAVTVAIAVPRADDRGREEVSGAAADRWRYRTPSLRNVALTGPYMHDGSLATLADVIAYYDAGGSLDPDQDPRIRPLGLSPDERQALLAFLLALTGSNVNALAADARSATIGDHGR